MLTTYNEHPNKFWSWQINVPGKEYAAKVKDVWLFALVPAVVNPLFT